MHVWSISIGKPSLSAHIEVYKSSKNHERVLIKATKLSRENGIYHSTI